MADPAGLGSIASVQQQARAEGKELIAEQLETEESSEESLEDAFNPQAADREQARKNRARPMEARKKESLGEEIKVKLVEKKGQQDVANRFSQRNPELPQNRLLQLRGQVNEKMTAEEILDEVESFFKDPSLADEALEFLQEVTDGELNAKITEARALLAELKGREVIAGRNIDVAAKSFAEKGVGTPSELRDLYRDVTQSQKGHNEMFTQLSGRYGFEELKEVVKFLLQGMSFDMKSKGPSIAEAELQLLMKELKNLQSILWVYLFFKKRKELMKSMYRRYKMEWGEEEEEELDFEKLAKNFIQIVEDRYPSVLKILKQAEKLGIRELEEKIVVLTQFRDAIRGLSPRLYHSSKHKQDLLTAILEALEDLDIELEEEYELEENESEEPNE